MIIIGIILCLTSFYLVNHLVTESMRRRKFTDKDINDLVVDIEEILLQGVYEPSERGVGYTSSESDIKQVENLIRDFLTSKSELEVEHSFEEKLYNLELNEVLAPDKFTEYIRVPGGWVLKSYSSMEEETCRISQVFIPLIEK